MEEENNLPLSDEENIKMDEEDTKPLKKTFLKKEEKKDSHEATKEKEHAFKLKEEGKSIKKSMAFLLIFLFIFFLGNAAFYYYMDGTTLYGEYLVYIYLADVVFALLIVFASYSIRAVNTPFKKAKKDFTLMFLVHILTLAVFYLCIVEETDATAWICGELLETFVMLCGIRHIYKGIQEKGYEVNKARFTFKRKKKFIIYIYINMALYVILYGIKISRVYIDYGFINEKIFFYTEAGLSAFYLLLGTALAVTFLIHYEKNKKYITSE